MHYQNGQGECAAWRQQDPGQARQGPETKVSCYRDRLTCPRTAPEGRQRLFGQGKTPSRPLIHSSRVISLVGVWAALNNSPCYRELSRIL